MVCKKKAQWELLLQNSSFFRRHGDLRRDRSFSASFLVSNVHVNRVTHAEKGLVIFAQPAAKFFFENLRIEKQSVIKTLK